MGTGATMTSLIAKWASTKVTLTDVITMTSIKGTNSYSETVTYADESTDINAVWGACKAGWAAPYIPNIMSANFSITSNHRYYVRVYAGIMEIKMVVLE